jgi:ATP-dependent exoDNAse (exonuclease V) beta subunit
LKNLVLYNSSAGSGKTYTLVKEFLLRVLDENTEFPAYYKHILAITFTNKAAAEMKERVIKALEDFASNQPIEGTSSFLMKDLLLSKADGGLGITKEVLVKKSEVVLSHMLHHYNDLAISTIDKFTHKIIRTFAHDLHLSINFEIELQEKEVLTKAIDLLIANVGKDEKITKLMVDFTVFKANEETSWNIEKDLISFAHTLLQENGSYFANQLSELTIDEFYLIKKELETIITSFENEAEKIANETLAFIKANGLEITDFSGSHIPKYFIKQINKDFDPPTMTVEKMFNGEQNWYAQKTPVNIKQTIDGIQKEITNFYQKTQTLRAEKYSDYIVAKMIHKNIYVLAVINEIEKSIESIKQENNVLSFSDFNKKIAHVIANESIPFIYERLGEKYYHYLIDEFQDTSVIQWFNLIPLVDNALANDRFNMVVGDAKQSIYRWRGGEVEQIIQFPKIVEKTGIVNKEIDAINASFGRNIDRKDLNNNFRSTAEIVDFNNQFFQFVAQQMPTDYQNLYKELNQEFDAKNTGGGIGITFFDSDDNDELLNLNLQQTLHLIHELTKEGYQLNDIAILTRANHEAASIASFLLENNIDVISSESLLLNNSKEVKFLVTFLKYLIYPNEKSIQLALLSLMPDSLANDVAIFELFIASSSKKEDVLAIFLKMNKLELDKNIINQFSLYELTEFLMNHFQLSKTTNIYLQFFLDKVYEFTVKKGNSINSFVEWWSEKSEKFSIIIPEGIEAVNIMTIHKSKGLEFPVVISPFANAASKGSKDMFWIENTPVEKLPVALLPMNKSILETVHANVYELEENKAVLDLINVLYVAFTRPKERLYILSNLTSTKSEKAATNKYLHSYCSNFTPIKSDLLTYRFGLFNKKSSSENQDKASDSDKFDKIVHSNWRKKIQISYQAPKVWEVENPEQIGEHGSSIHAILADIKTTTDIEKTVTRYVNKGVISIEESKELLIQLQYLFANPAINFLFNDVDEVKNETSILLPSGEVFQPDRVVIKQQTVYVIDYKTGEENSKHKKQIANYIAIISKIPAYATFKFKGFILYLKTNEVVEI